MSEVSLNALANLGATQSLEFVNECLSPGARILDVGCGDGQLARLLTDRGFRVTAIDSKQEAIEKAKASGVNAIAANFLQFESAQPFDCVLFSRALHHILPVEQSVERAHTLLVDQGVLLLEDFGAELLDEKSALWFYGLKSVIEADLESPKSRGPKTERGKIPADPLENWREHLFDKHHVAQSSTMLSAIAQIFIVEKQYRLPYLYRYFLDDCTSEQGRRIFEWESELCRLGSVIPVGVRVVARKTSAPPDAV